MFNLGFGEILVICVVLIIVVGPERLPALMKTVGKTMRTVRQASREIQSSVGLDEILREDVVYPMPTRAPVPPPPATISRDAQPAAPAQTPAAEGPLASADPPRIEAPPPTQSASESAPIAAPPAPLPSPSTPPPITAPPPAATPSASAPSPIPATSPLPSPAPGSQPDTAHPIPPQPQPGPVGGEKGSA